MSKTYLTINELDKIGLPVSKKMIYQHSKRGRFGSNKLDVYTYCLEDMIAYYSSLVAFKKDQYDSLVKFIENAEAFLSGQQSA